MSILWVDFETRSRCDLKTKGLYNYVLHPTTEILCMSYAFDDGDVKTWLPSQDYPLEVLNHLGQIRAHNAAFERQVFEYVMGIGFSLEQFYCTATQARANCAPGSLEDAGRFAGASMRKDFRGMQLIRALSLPRPDGTFNEDPALMAEMIAYCEQDVRAMRDISTSMRQLSDEELHDYHVNERINDRGFLVDVPLCKAAVKYSDAELLDVQGLVKEITEGVVTSVRSSKMKQWVMERVGPEALALMTVHKDGVKKFSIDKTVRANLLILADENPKEVPNEVADVIQCADDIWASSVAKFNRLALLADEEDHRVRGALVFAGGSATGRASSYGAQVHNFTRKCYTDPEAIRTAMVRSQDIQELSGLRVTDVLKGMLRPSIIPAPGKQFIVSDWASIEARVNPWLSNSVTGNDVLDIFRTGKDIYITAAAKIFRCDEEEVTKAQRLVGKIAVLALGYQGAVGAFSSMCRAYGVLLSEQEILKTVKAWRKANPWAVNQWRDLEEAATRAMRNKGFEIVAGRITYLFDGSHLWYVLPSGRILCYPRAKIDADGISYAKSAWKPAADAKEWPRAHLYGGLLTENCVQAIANDILRASLRECDKEGFEVILHIHDEIVVESDNSAQDVKRLEYIMTRSPEWCTELPLSVDIKILNRYGK
jgi:DNA polymerase